MLFAPLFHAAGRPLWLDQPLLRQHYPPLCRCLPCFRRADEGSGDAAEDLVFPYQQSVGVNGAAVDVNEAAVDVPKPSVNPSGHPYNLTKRPLTSRLISLLATNGLTQCLVTLTPFIIGLIFL
jgi:hypothetical protein